MPWHAHPGPPKPVRRGRPKCCTTCAQWRSWPAGPIWTGRMKLVSTSNCRCSRSVAPGELANVHPQTLRQYDRLGLVVPQRTDGGARRYSLRDISRLAKAQQLSQEEGINLAGIARILSLEEENRELRRQVERLRRRPVPACSRPMRTVTLWKSNVPAALACGVGRFRSTPSAAVARVPWRPRVSRLMRTTRAVGVSQAKTRGLRGVNPLLSRFLGLSCFGGLTDFQKTLKKNSKTGISGNRCACFVI